MRSWQNSSGSCRRAKRRELVEVAVYRGVDRAGLREPMKDGKILGQQQQEEPFLSLDMKGGGAVLLEPGSHSKNERGAQEKK